MLVLYLSFKNFSILIFCFKLWLLLEVQDLKKEKPEVYKVLNYLWRGNEKVMKAQANVIGLTPRQFDIGKVGYCLKMIDFFDKQGGLIDNINIIDYHFFQDFV